ncbi:MAG: fibronectin type III domain-containing protein, partial [Pricia sp.]
MKKILLSAGMLALLLMQSCSKEEEVLPPNEAPSSFEIEVSTTPNEIELDWTDAIDPEDQKVRYKITVGDDVIVSGIAASAYTLVNLIPNTPYSITITAIDEENGQTEVQTEVLTAALIIPTPFEVEQMGQTATTVDISWSASTTEDESDVTYDIFVNDSLRASNLADLSYTLHDLSSTSSYTVKVLAKSQYETSVASTIKVSTDGNTVIFGKANHPRAVPIPEADLGIIEIPVLVKDLDNMKPAEALADIHFEFEIAGTTNERDFKLLTPSPLIIAKGATEGLIRVSVVADDFQELLDETLVIAPRTIQNAVYSTNSKDDETDSDPTFIIDGTGELLSDKHPDAFAVDISWSHPEAYVSATLYQETSTPGVFTSIA